MIRLTTIIAVLTLSAHASAQNVDVAALKDLVPMPRGSFNFGFGVDSLNGIKITNEPIDHTAEIAAIEKSIQLNLDDAERYCRLSELYPASQKQKRDDAVAWAVDLAKRGLAGEPDNPKWIAQLGRAYYCARNTKNAEPLLRRAAKLSPNDPDRWIQLGYCLYCRGLAELVVEGNAEIVWDHERLYALLWSSPPSPEMVAAFRKAITESSECFDLAVAASRQNANSYLQRYCFRFGRSTTEVFLNTLFGAKSDQDVANQFLLDTDWQTIADLSPDDPRAIGYAVFTKAMQAVATSDEGRDDPIRFSPKDREIVDRRLVQLDKLMSHKDRRISNDARYCRAFLCFLADRNYARCARLIRDGIKDRPEHIPSLELLYAATVELAQWREALEVASLLVRLQNTPITRHYAARAAFEQNEVEVSERHLRAGLNLAPKDFNCNLGLAAVLTKRYSKHVQEEIRESLFRAEAYCPEENPNARGETLIVRSIFSALNGDVEFARRNTRELLEREPRNELAKDLARILEK